MSWNKVFGVIVLAALFGLLLWPGATVDVAEAAGLQAPVAATAPAMGTPVVVKSGGAALHDSPNGVVVGQLETGAIVQALSRTPAGDWIFVEVEVGVQGWLASNKLVSVNPASLPVYGLPQAEQSSQPAQPTAAPTEEPSPTASPTPEPTATATATIAPSATPTATAIPPTATATPQPTATPVAVAEQAVAAQQSEMAQSEIAPSAIASGPNPLLRRVGVVRSGGAVLTAEPSGTGATVLPAGEIVTLLQRSQDDGWLEVERRDGTTGWVDSSELLTAGLSKLPRVGGAMTASTSSSAPATAPPATEATTETATETDTETVATEAQAQTNSAVVLATVRTDGSRLNVRSGPGADSPVVAKADNASSYPALATSPDEAWVQIEIADAPDGSGWVSARYVTLSESNQ